MDKEQHLPYRATGDVVVLDGDGSRWVREGEANPVSEGEIRDFARSLRETALDPVIAAASAGSLERMWQFLASESAEASQELSGADLCAALANALDPTCHDVADFERESFKCSECGYRIVSLSDAGHFDAAVLVSPEGLIAPWAYCPNCGHRVLEGWERVLSEGLGL